MVQFACKSTQIPHSPALQWYWILAVVFIMAGCEQRVAEHQLEQKKHDSHSIEAGEQAAGSGGVEAARIDFEETLSTDPSRPRFDTPQACFTALQKAVTEQDPSAFISCYVKRYRNQRIGWYAFDLDMEVFFDRPHAAAAAKLLNDQGINVGEVMKVVRSKFEKGNDELAKVLVEVGGLIDRQDEFATNAAKLISKPFVAPFPDLAAAEFSEVKVGQQYAVGQYQNPDAEESVPISFQREHGSWLITPYINVKTEDGAGLTDR